MPDYGRMVPAGTGDLFFRECEALRKVEGKLCRLFESRGFSEVATPTMEYYDVFEGRDAPMPQEMMYKLVGPDGRILVLRPDNTMPVARAVSTKLKNMQPPLRLYYRQNVYRVSPAMSGRMDEIPQCGVELVGTSGMKSDIEIMLCAIDAMKSVTGRFRFEMGHVGYFNSVMDSVAGDGRFKRLIRKNVEGRNFAALEGLIEKAGDGKKALERLPGMSGGAGSFEEAVACAPNEGAMRTAGYLRELYEILTALRPEDDITADFGMVPGLDYYTGVVFRGYLKDSGKSVLSGGRYDGLYGRFGVEMPSVGFAVNTGGLSAAEADGIKATRPDVLIFSPLDEIKDACIYMDGLLRSGLICEISDFDTKERTLNYARLRGVPRVDILSNGKINMIKVLEVSNV